MKKQTGIWIDTSKAIIVSLHDGKDHMKEIESDIENSVYHEKEGNKGTFSGSHHSDSETKFTERRKKDSTDSSAVAFAEILHEERNNPETTPGNRLYLLFLRSENFIRGPC